MGPDEETRENSDEGRQLASGELEQGSCAGEYIIEGQIARGGCGTVYAAAHRRSGARVAVKILHSTLASSPRMVKRFLREVEVVRLLEHPAIVEIHDLGELPDGRPFYVMERLEGVTMDALLRDEGRLGPEDALDLLEPVCDALEAAHAAGIIHRDVKGSNLFITRGWPRTVKLLDFGIAKLTTPEPGLTGFTTAGRAPGTLTIMAPEQILGAPLDARVDIYALGVLLHRILTGAFPFYSRDAAELLRQHLEEPAPRPSRRAPLTPELDAVVLRCLEKQPEHRFCSVKSLLRALREAVGDPPSGRDSLPDLPVTAVGVHLELRVRTDADDLDDSLADDIGAVLDLAERRLQAAGFIVASTTGNEILTIRLLVADEGEARRSRLDALEVSAALYDEIARRPAADGRVHVNLCVHVGEVFVRLQASPEIVGGALARAGAWAPQKDVNGVCATLEAVDGLGALDAAPGPEGFVMLRRRPEGAARPASPSAGRADAGGELGVALLLDA